MTTRALTLEQKDQKSQKDQNNSLPHQVSLCKTLTAHAAEFPELKTLLHSIKERPHTGNKRGLVVVCTTSELMWIDYCLLVNRQ